MRKKKNLKENKRKEKRRERERRNIKALKEKSPKKIEKHETSCKREREREDDEVYRMTKLKKR